MEQEIYFSEYEVKAFEQPIAEWRRLSSWKKALNSPCRSVVTETEGRVYQVFDDLGFNFLTKADGESIYHIWVFFKLSKKPLPIEPKQRFTGTLRLGRYRLRGGISHDEAQFLEGSYIGPFSVKLSQDNERVTRCSVSFGE